MRRKATAALCPCLPSEREQPDRRGGFYGQALKLVLRKFDLKPLAQERAQEGVDHGQSGSRPRRRVSSTASPQIALGGMRLRTSA